MQYELTEEQIRSYRDNGFLVIQDFLSPEELEDWREKVMAALSERAGQKMPGKEAKTGEDDGINEDAGYCGKVSAPMKAGSCSFHNGLTIHGAGANMTKGIRRTMTCAYMPDGNVYSGQPNVLPDAYVRTLAMGDRLNNDAQNSLIYHKKLS